MPLRCSKVQNLVTVGLVLIVLGLLANSAVAQPWPEYDLDGHKITRGPGFYLSWWKLLSFWLLFLAWVKTTDWVNQDGQRLSMAHAIWNPVVFGVFLAALLLAGFTLPMYPVGFGVTALAWLVPLLVYVAQRNSKVDPHEKVMTPAHLRFLLAQGLNKIGIKMASEARAAHEKGAQVEFEASGNMEESQASIIRARQNPGFVPTKALVASAADHRAEKVMLDFTQTGVTSRYQVDGVWHDSDDRDRDTGDSILSVLKTLGGMEPDERRKRQEGRFQAEYERKKLHCTLVSQGTKTGERAMLAFTKPKVPYKTLEELGMRPKMVERLKELMLSQKGVLLFSSMPGGGLSTTLHVALNSTDRLLRDFIAVEDKHDAMYEVENVDSEFYDSKKGETPAALLDAIARKQPDVLLVPNFSDKPTVEALCEIATEDQMVWGTMRAKEAVEVLLRVLLLKVSAKHFAPRAIGVLNQRLVRRLCDECKEGFEPQPALLKKLGIPPGRVEMLYKHPENPDKVCEKCKGIGYQGRVAIFELLTVDKGIREALVKSPKLEVLRQLARQAGHRSLQEEGIATVVQGITSLPELMRILKQ